MPILAVASPRSAALAPFVASMHLTGGEIPVGRERSLPGGHAHLMVNLHEDEFRTYPVGWTAPRRSGGAVLQGPHTHASVIDTMEQRLLVCVDFRPGGAAAFFRGVLGEARDQLIDLERLWGSDGAFLRERMLKTPTSAAQFAVMEDVLVRHLGSVRPDPLIPFAATALQRGATVAEAAEAAGLLASTFTRRFHEGMGLTPKLYARVRRLQRVLGGANAAASVGVDWAALAVDNGFADQAHLIHDFRDLTGLTPSEYHPRAAHEQNHVPVS